MYYDLNERYKIVQLNGCTLIMKIVDIGVLQSSVTGSKIFSINMRYSQLCTCIKFDNVNILKNT